MAERNLNTTLKQRLINNEPFAYAHLIKYERPYATLVSGKHSTDAKRYAYLTDAAVNITFDDGSYATDGTTANGNQIYIADKVYKVGSYSETSQAKATGMTLELGSESLNNSFTFISPAMTSTVIDLSTTVGSQAVDLVKEGFREGDKILLSSDGDNDGKEVRITGIRSTGSHTNNYMKIATIDDALTVDSETVTFKVVSDELKGPLLEMNDATLKSYHNRDVFIYKAFLDPDDYSIIGAPILIFKGIISSASLKEDPNTSIRVSWKLTSHWGDFASVNGRFTNDAVHRALDNNGVPQPELALKEVYSRDLGFQHAETTMNILATYKAIEQEIYLKKKKKFFGLIKSYSQETRDIEVERQANLNFALSSKYIPVVYGIDRIAGIPIFVDTKSSDSNNIYIVYALAEGEIGGIYDLYIDSDPLICSNLEDWDDRNLSGVDSDSVANSANDVDVVCRGRADKGDTLGGESMSGTSTGVIWPAHAWGGREGGFHAYAGDKYIVETIYYRRILDATKKALNTAQLSTDGSGVLDGKTISITKPNKIYLTIHSGKTHQLADDTLISIAEGDKFKRQADYFTTTGDEYWGPNHTLSDTAYVVMDCEIGEDATTVPEIEYVVRGKYVDSFNYDFSYLHDPSISGEDASDFKVGDIVGLKNTTGGAYLTKADDSNQDDLVVIDKWTIYGPDGLETRFRFSESPRLTYSDGVPAITSFYMTDDTNNWHMVTYNHAQNSGTVPSALSASGTTTTSGELPVITFQSDPGWTTPFPSYKNRDDQLPIAFTTSARNYADLSFPVTESSSGTVLTMTGVVDGTGFVETGSYGEPVIRTDAIKLATSASDVDDYYNDMKITLTITKDAGSVDSGDTTTHTRKIIDYDGGTEIAQVDRPWDQGKEPERDSGYTYTYKINTPEDKRVSINPAMQLLDYITSQTYGKRLDIDKDIALSDWLLSARTCDSRGTQTCTVTGTPDVVAGDRYILQKTDSSSSTDEVIAMGMVKTTAEDVTSVEFEECFGKFSKTFMKNFHAYSIGDIVVTASGYYKCTTAGTKSTKPTGSNPTGWTGPLASITLRKLGTLGTTLTVTNVNSGIYSDYNTYSIYNSDFVKYWRYLGWEDHHQRWVTRHQLCGVVDTSSSVFDTINGFLTQFNGLLSYEAGLYVLRIETTSSSIASAKVTVANSASGQSYEGYTVGAEANIRYITNDDIIGSISVTDPGPKKAYNTMTSTIGDPGSRFQGKQVSFYDSNFLKTDKMVIKSGSHTQPAVSSYFNARINVENALRKSRFGMKIAFKLGPKALLLLAGETIAITYAKFEWSGKKFRVSNINFNTDCTASINATEYDDSFYTISTPKLPSLLNEDVRTSIAAILGTPNSLVTDAVTMGNIDLTWINGSAVAPANKTEIWVASSNDRTKATLLAEVPCVSSIEQRVNGAVSNSTSVTLDSGNGVLIGQLITGTGISGTVTVAGISGTALTLSSAQTIADNTDLLFDNTGSYQHSIGEDARTKYYWIRHKKITPNNIPRYSGWHPTSSTGGVTATSTIPEIFYSVTVSSNAQIFTANSSSVIQSPDTIKFTATKNALSAAFVWSTSPSVNLYAATSGGSPITSGSVVYLRKGDFSGDTVSVTATVTSTSAERTKGADNTYAETIAIPRVDAGGAAGASAKSVRLRASSFTFKEAITGEVSPDYIQLDAVKQNTTATANWAVTDDSPSVDLYAATTGGSAITTGNTVYMRKADFSTNTAVTVTLTCDSIVDTTNIVRLEEDSGTVIAVLSNPAHVLPADYLGAVTNAQAVGSGTNIRVYEGTAALTFVTGTPGAGEWAVSVGNTADITEGGVTDQGTYATIASHTGVTTGTDTYKITYTITGKTRKADSFTSFTVDQYLTKAKAGSQGVVGYSVNLTANDHSIVYNAAGTSPTPSTSTDITLTAATQGFTDPYFKFTGDGISDEGSYTDGSGSSDTFTFPVPAAIGDLTNPSTVKVSIQEGSSGGESASDTISIYGIQPGADGSDGTVYIELKIQFLGTAGGYTLPESGAAFTGGSFNFANGAFTPPSGWTLAIPNFEDDRAIYQSTATASAAAGATDSSITWTTPALLSQGSESLDIFYIRAATEPTPPVTSVDNTPSGWSTSISGTSGSDTLWEVIAKKTLTVGSHFRYTFSSVKQASFTSYTVLCTNESHTYASDITGGGVVTTGSGTEFEVFRGSTQLTGVLTGTPTVNQFKVTATGTNITPSSTYGASISSNSVVFADHTAGTIMSGVGNLAASISYSIAISTGVQANTVTKKQTFVKTLKPKAPTGYRTYISVGEIIRDSDGAYSADYIDIDFTFNEEGAAVARDRFRINRSSDTWSTSLTAGTHASGDLNPGLLATAVTVSGRSAVLKVTYTDSAGVKAEVPAEVVISHDGIETITASLYKLNDSSIGNASTGTFADPANGQEAGWTLAVPTLGTTDGNTIYVSTRKFLSVGGGVGTWTTPVIHSKYTIGATGSAGLNTATVALYRKNTSSSSAPSAFSGTFTYTFATGAVTGGTLNSWTTAVPDLDNGEYAWVRQATASANTSTDTVPTSEFSAAVVHSGVGADGSSITGAAGNSNALVSLYRVNTSSSSAPTAFTGTITYTYSGGGVATDGNLQSWTTTVPTVPQGSFLWIRQATASSNTSTDTIAIGEWSAAVVVSASGSDGAAGSDGKLVNLTAADYSIVYDVNGANPDPSAGNMTLTATSQGFTDGYFKFTGDGVSDDGSYLNGTGANVDTHNFTVPSSHFDDPKTVRVGVAEANQTEIAFDTITITAVKPGATGSAGIDGLTFIITNSSHVFSATTAGAVSDSYVGSGTIIEVYEGSTALTYDASSTANGYWKTTEATTNISVGTKTDSGAFLTVGVHSGVADGTDESKIIYTVAGKRASGASFSHTLQQSFSKSKIGATGDDAVSLNIHSNYPVFLFKNPDDTTPDPATITITANQQNQASNLATGDLTVTNGSKSTGSYSGSSGTGTYTWVVTPGGTYPVTCAVSNDSLSDTVIITKVVGTASLAISTNSPTFAFKNPNDTTPDPATVTITATQQNQTSNLVDGDLATPTNGTKASFSYSGSDGSGAATWVVTPTGYPVTCVVTNDSLSGTVIIPKVVGAASLGISSNYLTFSFDNSSDTTPTPATVTITATQQNQTSNLVTGDLAVTNGSKNTGSYSGSDGSGTYTWTVTPSGTYPVTCVVSNDSLSSTVVITKTVGGDTPAAGTRGYSIFTIEENTDGNTTAANVTNWVGTLNEANAEDIAGAVIALADDNYIRPNDRITVTDNSADKAGTRIFVGTATGTEGDVDHEDFSALVVETFSGSVIVDGTLAADKLTSGFVYTQALQVGSGNTVFNVNSAGDIWSGHATEGSATFQVDNTGALKATKATIGGWTVDATSIFTGTEDHSAYTANAGDMTFYSNGSDSSIHANKFYIDTSGNLTATSATISGVITATSGTFTGTVNANAGTFTGITVNTGTIGGWVITSTKIAGSNIELDDANDRILISD